MMYLIREGLVRTKLSPPSRNSTASQPTVSLSSSAASFSAAFLHDSFRQHKPRSRQRGRQLVSSMFLVKSTGSSAGLSDFPELGYRVCISNLTFAVMDYCPSTGVSPISLLSFMETVFKRSWP
ncbi:unnamed protein product [Microthlaspi erraticum]|uniref:Uncharacterized protein n=1 Tax=Microthlaspi erraticum TaxID=1685480 RepID=A0A6D2HZV9_9BRAS|nr:unnamed protein product [Microthlaspi erraticum]